MGWNGVEWADMCWNGLECAEMGCNGLKWARMGWHGLSRNFIKTATSARNFSKTATNARLILLAVIGQPVAAAGLRHMQYAAGFLSTAQEGSLNGFMSVGCLPRLNWLRQMHRCLTKHRTHA